MVDENLDDTPSVATMTCASRSSNKDGQRDSAKVLFVAFNFPPESTSTGRLRTLGLIRHLGTFGWSSVVLSASPRAYPLTEPRSLAEVPAGTPVHRAFAIDARRHLGWRGRYFSWLAIPDRWIWWWPAAVVCGLRLIRKERISAICSTYPIATTHLIGLALARISGRPWIADFRDPLVPEGSQLRRSVLRWIEKRTLARADQVVFTTSGARQRYAQRFPEAEADGKLSVIPNGYEDNLISGLEEPKERSSGRLRLVHAGVLYKRGRNPFAFFAALAQLRAAGKLDADTVQVVLRASAHRPEYQAELDRLGIADIVSLPRGISHREALQEQMAADGLLLFQGGEFNAQIPAKVYEYLCIGRPIFSLIDPAGDTTALLQRTGGALCARIDGVDEIAAKLFMFLKQVRTRTFPVADPETVRLFSRSAAAAQFARLLDQVTDAS